MKRMLLPALAFLLALSSAAQGATIQSVLNCSARNVSVAINEHYSIGSSGYSASTAAATVKDRFQSQLAMVTPNSFGLAGSPTVLILNVDKTTIMLMMPRRAFLSFEQEQVKAKLIVDNGRSEEAVCHVTPLAPKSS